ncbi:MAG: Na/Pi cotransporter family protein, partial [Myxococcales bacterium]
VVMQSSSAAVATTLTALHTGTIGLDQAAALVIGQNIGTTVTAAIAAIGASVPAKRTALSHILFNGITGLVALLALPLFLRVVEWAAGGSGVDHATSSLAAFHTVFNLAGVVLFLPVIHRFAAFIERVVPEARPQLTRNLDRSVVGLPAVAIEAAQRTAREIAAEVYRAVGLLLDGEREQARGILEEAQGAIDATRAFLAQVSWQPESAAEFNRHLATMEALQHLQRLIGACREIPPSVDELTSVKEVTLVLRQGLERGGEWMRSGTGAGGSSVIDAARQVAERRRERRQTLLDETARGAARSEDVNGLLESMHWLERVATHAARASEELGGATQPPPAPGVHAA